MNELGTQLEVLQGILIARATGLAADHAEYQALRAVIVNHPALKDIVPEFLRTCRSVGEFWQFIQSKFPSYAERRKFLWDEFRPLFERLEGANAAPSDLGVSTVLEKFDTESVQAVWLRALQRRESEPEGAITLARTLLETVCKHILDERGTPYNRDADLPALYRLTAEGLNIAPSQHSEPIFKQILGGCTAVVEGLGALRNRIGDAHGQGKRPVKPSARHAELAVNLSGAVAVFLVSTHLMGSAGKSLPRRMQDEGA